MSHVALARKTGGRFLRLGSLLSLVVGITTNLHADETSRLATYEHEGQTYFALSVSAQLRKDLPSDILVLVDTSASQTNAYRADSFECLKALIAHMQPEDRVRICAVDLDRVAYYQGFTGKDAPGVNTALNGLDQRAPLGSTDMVQALSDVASEFDSQDRVRNLVYIGDGMSRGNLLASDEFRSVIQQLANERISVSSFAIGPQRDVQMLAGLANQTGGNLLIDNPQSTPQEAGKALAQSCRAEVFWPDATELPASFSNVLPGSFPPIRADRDTVVIGKLASIEPIKLSLAGTTVSQRKQLSWSLTPEDSNDDFSHLPKLHSLASRDNGISLPTVGSSGMKEVRRMLLAGADDLTRLGSQALAIGDLDGAERMAEAALKNDPVNPQAISIQTAVKKKGKNSADVLLTQTEGGEGPPLVGQPQEGIILDGGPADTLPTEQAPVDNGFGVPMDNAAVYDATPMGGVILEGGGVRPLFNEAPAEFESENGRLIDAVEARRRAREGALKSEVRAGLGSARRGLRTDPARTVRDLKVLLDTVLTTPDIADDVRLELRGLVEGAIQAGARRQIEKEARDRLLAERRAREQERADIIAATTRKEQQLKQILNRFNFLMSSGEYDKAMQTADVAYETFPEFTESDQVYLVAQYASRYDELMRIRRLRENAFTRVMMSIDRAAIPFVDEPPLVFPPKEDWLALTARRKKYASADLSSINPAEQRILDSLDDPTDFEFIDTPLEEVVTYLEDKHEIEIEIDNAALDILGLDSSSLTITRKLSGISLRSAFRLILGENDLTYVVRDEVLMITSQEEAAEQLSTRVYPVGDLVLPITSGLGAMGGGIGGIGGGGLGGQLNGGGGGFGGGGGGFGGGGGGFGGGGGGFGGGGFGGGGGFFQVDDPLVLRGDAPTKTTHRKNADAEVADIIQIRPKSGETHKAAWLRFFQEQQTLAVDQQVSGQAIRATVAQLFTEKRFTDAADVIQAALTRGFPQPWMFESLGLALQAQGADTAEIERAVMSAVDISTNIDELFYAATYLSQIGLESRALTLLKDITQLNPNRTEPLALALKLARKTKEVDALRWTTLAVARQAWPLSQRDFEVQARRTADALVITLRRQGRNEEAAEFEKQLATARARDCVAKITWSGKSDLDLLVQEPGGTVCSLRNPRTTSGGALLGDGSLVDESSATASESYSCPEGFDGEYRLLVRPIWGQVDAGKVTVEVTLHQGTPQEETIRKQLPIERDPIMVRFQLADGRRQESLDEQLVAASVENQLAVNGSILAQQLAPTTSTSTGSEAAEELALDRFRLANGLAGRRLQGAVGFRPVITTLPSGTTMSVTAVVSADRRYVRITPSPLFSGVTDVDTFSFVGGTNAGGGGGVGGGGVGGGGVGGGGVGGGGVGGGGVGGGGVGGGIGGVGT